ncbi:glycoside hydrolase family 97 protein [Roseateles asaccharophilus]|uniref:Alpha-glucosidase n=1 Tax=Roseateles asaccharophilus TaxID=582607 RepID=A0ABU2A6U5_9BURK|nr:glycoside hydrolase family 97 protein [Roseateles asaccharophilus]MDR7332916.1 alpha-glucosidase [Roseateles asaccharophilus]
MLKRLLCLLSFVCCTSAHADETLATVTSPNKQLAVTLQLTGEGRLSYRVDRAGKPLVNASRLGLLLTNAHQLDGGFKLVSQRTTERDETWEQPWGESRRVRSHYRELAVELSQPGQGDRRMALRFRVFDDGFGFRYELPAQRQLPIARISDELTEFDIAEPATAWWTPAGEALVLEYVTQRAPLAELGLANTPLTMRTQSGLHLALHEAALVDYASMWVRKVGGQKLRAQLAPSSQGATVERRGAFTTPWRTLRVAESAGALYESNLELNLNEPNQLGDVSWFKPGKYAGVWWEMHLNQSTWSSGLTHGATTANAKRHIDFAAKHGFGGVLVEGWNVGWDGNWVGSQSAMDHTKAMPDFDLAAVTAYAKAKGVKLIGHHETGGNIARYEQQMDAAYALYARHGVDVVKSGYVTDAGTAQFANADGKGTHFGFTESQAGVRHMLKAVQQAAKHKIAIDTHEPVKDTGLRRTYPNWVSREGARGQEFNAWGDPINPVDHEVNLVFTRMLSGPMDYTPGVLSLNGAGNRKLNSTQAKQLALYVVLYSPVHMVPDLIAHYERWPKAFQFIKDVPTDWETTKVIHGELGEVATIARKDRRSDDWYVGAVTNGDSRRLTLPLGFLDPGRRYRAEIYRDGDQADYRDEQRRFDLVTEQVTVQSTDTLPLRLAPGGGQAIRFTPLPR